MQTQILWEQSIRVFTVSMPVCILRVLNSVAKQMVTAATRLGVKMFRIFLVPTVTSSVLALA